MKAKNEYPPIDSIKTFSQSLYDPAPFMELSSSRTKKRHSPLEKLPFPITLSLSIKTFDTIHLKKNKRALERILFLFQKENLLLLRKISQPTRKQYLTLLRSPHIDKKSREQFSKESYKFVYTISFINSKTMGVFFSYIQKNNFKGASFSGKWQHHDQFKK